MALTEKLRFRCEPELKKQLVKLAEANKRTLSNYVILVLEREAAKELAIPRERPRLEKVRAGRIVPARSSQPERSKLAYEEGKTRQPPRKKN